MLELMAREISHSIVKFTFPQELQVVCCKTNSDINLNINIHTKNCQQPPVLFFYIGIYEQYALVFVGTRTNRRITLDVKIYVLVVFGRGNARCWNKLCEWITLGLIHLDNLHKQDNLIWTNYSTLWSLMDGVKVLRDHDRNLTFEFLVWAGCR